jgi:hypothetical protein
VDSKIDSRPLPVERAGAGFEVIGGLAEGVGGQCRHGEIRVHCMSFERAAGFAGLGA